MMRASSTFRSESGVAMVTVLFVAAALTAVTSVAAFATIREFQAGSDDRKAVEAIALAEAGIDRYLTYIKSGLLTFRDMNKAGCGSSPPLELPVGSVGNGTYTASLTVYDPTASGTSRFPPDACANRPLKPHNADGDLTYFVIRSVGQHPAARREIQQVIALKPVGLPIGLYANRIDIQSARHPFENISMISETTISNRGQAAFIGEDSYYLVKDFYSGVTGSISLDSPIPAAAHAATQILLGKSSDPEFTADAGGTHNCEANNTLVAGSVAFQALWDGDGSSNSGTIAAADITADPSCTGQSGYPNSSKFLPDQLAAFSKPRLSLEDHQALREAAKIYGVYCSFPGTPPAVGDSAGQICYKQNVLQPATATYDGLIEAVSSVRNSFVAYMEFRSGTAANNNLLSPFSVWGCTDTDPNPPDTNKSVVLVARNGGVKWLGGAGQMISGAFLIDGNFEVRGGLEFDGTIVAGGTIAITSASQHFRLSDCAIENLPGPFFQTIPGHWSEIDR